MSAVTESFRPVLDMYFISKHLKMMSVCTFFVPWYTWLTPFSQTVITSTSININDFFTNSPSVTCLSSYSRPVLTWSWANLASVRVWALGTQVQPRRFESLHFCPRLGVVPFFSSCVRQLRPCFSFAELFLYLLFHSSEAISKLLPFVSYISNQMRID